MTTPAITKTKAARVHQPGNYDAIVVEEVDLPVVGLKDVLIKVEAAGLNFIDTYHRSGLYKLPVPFILGREGAGVVVSTGAEVTDVKVGDKVGFLGRNSYTQYVVIPADTVIPLPSSIDLKIAAASLLQGITAHYLTQSTFQLKPGHVALVHAGAGGTGGLIIEMAKISGATVITTASTEEKVAICKQLGADYVINYNETNFLEEVKKITDGKGVDVVYDGVGKTTWESSMKCLKKRGYLVLFGNASGPVPAIDPLQLTNMGSIYLTRPTMLDYIAERKELLGRCDDLFNWIQQGKVTIRVAKEFPLDQAKEAQEYLAGRNALGKVILDLST